MEAVRGAREPRRARVAAGRPAGARAEALLCTTLLVAACAGDDAAAGDAPAGDAAGEAPAGVLAITGGTVIPMWPDASPLPGHTVLIRDGLIADVGPDGDVRVPAGAETIDATGRFVIPGLVDAHVHLATDPAAEGWRERVETQLATLLDGGVTMVRDMGGDARALRQLAGDVASGLIPGPTIHYSAVLAGPGFFEDPRVQSSSRGVTLGEAAWARRIDAGSDVDAVVRDAAATGATGVKLYALVDPELMRRIADAAHDEGLRVWAHSTVFPARPSDAVEAGVDVLSHAAYLVWNEAPPTENYRARASGDYHAVPPRAPAITTLLQRMEAADVRLDATLAILERPAADEERARARAEWTYEVVRLADELGVGVAAGTDLPAGEGAAPIHDELAALVERAGLAPGRALMAATRYGAWALGLEGEYGTITRGNPADVVILDANPLADILNTRRIFAVIKGGVRVR